MEITAGLVTLKHYLNTRRERIVNSLINALIMVIFILLDRASTQWTWLVMTSKALARNASLYALEAKYSCVRTGYTCTLLLSFHQWLHNPVNHFFLWYLGIFMYKFSDNFLPSTFQSYFTSVINIHQYHTWSHNFYAPFTRSSFSMTTLRFYGPRLWNALDPLIKSQILCRLIKKSPY